jgi:alpha-mannosidase
LFPHAGGWRDAGVVAEARGFNQPLIWAIGEAEERSLARVDDPNLLIDTVKLAEDADALVLRLYEAHGARGTAKVELALPFARAWFANLLEEPGAEAEVVDHAIIVPYRPHEILTLMVE